MPCRNPCKEACTVCGFHPFPLEKPILATAETPKMVREMIELSQMGCTASALDRSVAHSDYHGFIVWPNRSSADAVQSGL